MTDDKDAIVQMQSAPSPIPTAASASTAKISPKVSNLMTIYGTFTGKSMDEIAAEFEARATATSKMAVAEVTADALAPSRPSTARFLPIKRMLMRVLKSGAERASAWQTAPSTKSTARWACCSWINKLKLPRIRQNALDKTALNRL